MKPADLKDTEAVCRVEEPCPHRDTCLRAQTPAGNHPIEVLTCQGYVSMQYVAAEPKRAVKPWIGEKV